MSTEKYKDKIRKLLQLSMSDNENEAAIALKQAMALMNKHNITEDEVHRQQMMEELVITPYRRPPDWYAYLYSAIGNLSGCLVVHEGIRRAGDDLAKIRIVGRERDVENTIYLVTYISRALEKRAEVFKKQLQAQRHPRVVKMVKDYKSGFIHSVYERIKKTQEQFFTQTSSTEIVCMDSQSRAQEAEEYFCNTTGSRLRYRSNRGSHIQSALEQGASAGNDLQINNAVNRQNDILAVK